MGISTAQSSTASNALALISHKLKVSPPPWDYNPSAWRERIPVCVLATIAFFIAFYMALYQWRIIPDIWDPVFGDQTKKVLDSDVSKTLHKLFRIPDAAFGAFAYLGDAVFGLAGSTRRWQYRPWMVILFGIDVIPLGAVSIILVILQGTLVGSWCFLCLVTAAISLILIVMAYDEVLSSLLYLHRIWKKTHDKKLLWNTFMGKYSERTNEIAEDFLREKRKKHVG